MRDLPSIRKIAFLCGLAWLGLGTLIAPAEPVPGVNVSPFGAQTVWPNDPNLTTILNRMQEAGIQWARFDLCWWGLCESTPGEYNFTPSYSGSTWDTDGAIQMLHDRGIEPFPILCYGNPLYDNGQGPFSEAGRQAYGNFCHAAAERYKNSVTYWEIWNEPNLEFFWGRAPNAVDYAQLAQVAAGRIREGNPQAIVAGGVTSGIDLGFLQTAFDNGLLDAVDAITIHPYRIAAPESIAGEVSTIRSMIAARTSRSIAVWTGEWGYNTYWSEVSEKGQAKCLSRMMTGNLAMGIDLSIWFSTHAFVEISGSDHDAEWGLLDYDFTPRPSFYAMRTLNQRLPAPVHSVADPLGVTLSPSLSNQRIEVFERGMPEQLTVAIWLARWPLSDSFAGETTTVRLQVPEGTTAAAYDGLDGDAIQLTEQRQGDRLELRNFRVMDYPVFVEVALPAPSTTQANWHLK